MQLSTQAQAEDNWVDVYGKIMLSLDKVDQDNGDDQWELNSHASRFGIKGSGDAGSLTAFYQLEWEVDIADKSKGSNDNIKSRNQVVGLRGGFGEIFAGRHDTPTKKLQKKIDLFGDLDGDIKHTFNGEVRANNIVQYGSPKANGFQAKVAFIPGEETGVNDGLADATSVAFEYKTGGLNLGVSFDADVEGEGVDTTRAMAQYKTGDWQFGFMFQDTDNNGASDNGYMVSAKYKMGDNALKLQLIDSDIWQTGVSSKVKYSSQMSLGWDRKLGKKTTFMTYLTMSEEGATGDKDNTFGIGLIQKF
jgi:predicted porin